jgi:alpha-1,3-mannosyltransferase
VFTVYYAHHKCPVCPYKLRTWPYKTDTFLSQSQLRLFNDGVASLFTHVAILLAQTQSWIPCFVFLSLGTSVKMNVLLVVPPALVLLVAGSKPSTAVCAVVAFVSVQILLAAPFLLTFPNEYFAKAFEFTRQFQYKWTVNWRMLRKQTFLSKEFAYGLLVCHLGVLFLFAHTKWYPKNKGKNKKNEERFFWFFFRDWFARVPTNALPLADEEKNTRLTSPTHVLTTLHEGAFIGIVFARSLHYQFYAWYFFSLPWLLWRCFLFDGMGKFVGDACMGKQSRGTFPYPTLVSSFLRVGLFLAIERSWNVFPATTESSATLFAAHLVLLAGLWWSPSDEKVKKK